ncbi:MAG: hypothetical protein JWQ73_1925 [Variovorax sp.]|jgi:type VI protein secretion system component Hcp|nr:hypothetical protein [Variovorax sp.]
MSLNADGRIDTDEALRLLDLSLQSEGANDIALSIDNNRTPVEGESMRTYSDGKHRISLLGYDVHAGLRMAPGVTTASLVLSHLYVVRRTDAATAPIASLLRSPTANLKLTLSIYRAGGDNIQDTEPMVEFTFEGARVSEIALLTGGAVRAPSEIIRFGYRVMKIQSAPQLASGIRGAVSTCELTMSS